jgi:pilus assembly protein Flp/PilA
MKTVLIRSLRYLGKILKEEHGQDLVEYALVVAMIAFGAIIGMKQLSTGINKAFSGISTTLTTDV